jgi:hypothetical protein
MALRDPELSGIWGGPSERERRIMRRELGIETGPETFPCGHCGSKVERLSFAGMLPAVRTVRREARAPSASTATDWQFCQRWLPSSPRSSFRVLPT